MSRSVSLIFAAALLAATGGTALANDGRYASVPALPPVHGAVTAPHGSYEGEWVGDWENEDRYNGEWAGTYTDRNGRRSSGTFNGTFMGDARFVSDDGRMLYQDGASGWREDAGEYWGVSNATPYPTARRAMPANRGQMLQPLGYSMAQRADWLDRCRATYYSAPENRRNSGLIGSLLGALIGGFAGNRIADGDRLAGTLIGAGVGGVAGAVLGSVAGRSSRDNRRAEAIDECEAYLLRYENSQLQANYQGQHYAHGYYAGPVMMVRVPIQRRAHVHTEDCYEVIEEWVEEAPAPRAARAVRRVPVAAPAPTKLQRAK